MTCNFGKSHPISLYDAKEAVGWKHGYPASEKDKRHIVDGRRVTRTPAEIHELHLAEEKTIILPESAMFICGDFEADVCQCGYFADLLCDYPTGRGKTCDASLCPDCAYQVGEDRHLCLVHYAQHKGVARVNPWPPKRKGTTP